MPQTNFGAGFMYVTPQGAAPTSVLFGALQDVSIDWAFDLKQVYGQYQFPIEQFRGKAKIDMKASVARLDANLLNQTVWGQAASTGERLNSISETGTVTTGAITVANNSTFVDDLIVYNPTSGKFYTRVATSPTAGQYSVSGGVYTFNTSENGNALRISYSYSSASTGVTVTATNQQMGSGPIFSIVLLNTVQNATAKKSMYVKFPAVQAPKLSMPFKLDDPTLPQIELSPQDDGSGNVWTWTNTL